MLDSIRCTSIWMVLILVTLPGWPNVVRAQASASVQTPDSAIAAVSEQLARELRKIKAKKIVILEFHGPQQEVHPVGKWLLDRISANLHAAEPRVQLVDRGEIKNGPSAQGSAPAVDVSGKDGVLDAGRTVQADAVVTGTFERVTDDVRITLNISSVRRPADKSVVIAGSVPISDEMRALSTEPIPWSRDIVRAGVGGISSPRCVRCPFPEYTDKARSAHFEGTVTLDVVVSANGDVESAIVVKTPGYGLEQKALEAVRKWKLRPAKGPDGNPVRTRVIVEMAFRLT